MSLADQKLDTMPAGLPASILGVDANGLPVLFPTWVMLAQSSAPVSHTGDTTETVIATVTIPAGAMGPNGRLRISSLWSTPGGSGNNKTGRCRIGGLAGTILFAGTNTTQLSYEDNDRVIGNRNSESSQVARSQNSPTGGQQSAAVVTAAINTANATTVVFTAQLANAGETVTLESYSVELLYAP